MCTLYLQQAGDLRLCPPKGPKHRSLQGPVIPPRLSVSSADHLVYWPVTRTWVLLQLVISSSRYLCSVKEVLFFSVLRFSSWKNTENPSRNSWPKSQNICASRNVCILARTKSLSETQGTVKAWHKLPGEIRPLTQPL